MFNVSTPVGGQRFPRCGAVILAALLAGGNAHANYLCSGTVSYLGVGAGGDVTIALANSTPIHSICSLANQGSYLMSVPACKAAHASFMAARLTGKAMAIYYNNEPLTCSTLPAWGVVPGVYFVQGPD